MMEGVFSIKAGNIEWITNLIIVRVFPNFQSDVIQLILLYVCHRLLEAFRAYVRQ